MKTDTVYAVYFTYKGKEEIRRFFIKDAALRFMTVLKKMKVKRALHYESVTIVDDITELTFSVCKSLINGD